MSYLEEQLNIKEGEPHYKAAMYVKEHGLSLLDFDCWTHLEDLLGFEISYDDYCKADSTIEGDLLEVEHGDETHHAILRALNGEQPQRTTIYMWQSKTLSATKQTSGQVPSPHARRQRTSRWKWKPSWPSTASRRRKSALIPVIWTTICILAGWMTATAATTKWTKLRIAKATMTT